MMSRSGTANSRTCWAQVSSARMVRGDSQIPPIIISRPASIRLAIAISPSRANSSTEPISRKYIRTGSSEPLTSPSDRLPDCGVSSLSLSTSSAASTTVTPISLSETITSSICSEVSSPCGSAAFSSSWVTKPRSLPFLISALTAVFLVSRIGASLFCS